MEVAWVGTFVPEFERNKRIAEYLEACGDRIQVRQIRVRLWPADRIGAFTDGRLSVFLKMLLVYPVLAARLIFAKRPDIFLVSYPGWFDLPVVKAVAVLKRRPVVFDVFISLHDTAVHDRALATPESLVARLLRIIDRFALRCSNRVIADCPSQGRFFAELGGLSELTVGTVYLGADENVFRPRPGFAVDPSLVLFYGTFVPLQGVSVIIEAAEILKHTNFRFQMVGGGQTHGEAVDLAQRLNLSNVEFLERMPQRQLVERMYSAAICLGIFGTSPKADRVIPHKVFEALACGRPVVTAATSAVSETFSDDEVLMVQPGSATALANAISSALGDSDLLNRRARIGNERFVEDFSQIPQSRRLESELRLVLEQP